MLELLTPSRLVLVERVELPEQEAAQEIIQYCQPSHHLVAVAVDHTQHNPKNLVVMAVQVAEVLVIQEALLEAQGLQIKVTPEGPEHIHQQTCIEAVVVVALEQSDKAVMEWLEMVALVLHRQLQGQALPVAVEVVVDITEHLDQMDRAVLAVVVAAEIHQLEVL